MTGERKGSECVCLCECMCVFVWCVSSSLTFPSLVLQPKLYIWSNAIFPLLSSSTFLSAVFCHHTVFRAPLLVSKSSVGSLQWPNWSSASKAWPQGCRVLRAPWVPPWCWRRATHVWSLWSASQSRLENCSLPMTRSVQISIMESTECA